MLLSVPVIEVNGKAAEVPPSRHGVVRYHEPRDLEFIPKPIVKQLIQGVLGAIIGSAMGVVTGASTLASSGVQADPMAGLGHMFAGVGAAFFAGYNLRDVPADLDEHGRDQNLAFEVRLEQAKESISNGMISGIAFGAMGQFFSGSSDQGGSSASLSSSSTTGKDGEEEKLSPIQMMAQNPLVHCALSGATGAFTATFLRPEIVSFADAGIPGLKDQLKSVLNDLKSESEHFKKAVNASDTLSTTLVSRFAKFRAALPMRDVIAQKLKNSIDKTTKNIANRTRLIADGLKDSVDKAKVQIKKSSNELGKAVVELDILPTKEEVAQRVKSSVDNLSKNIAKKSKELADGSREYVQSAIAGAAVHIKKTSKKVDEAFAELRRIPTGDRSAQLEEDGEEDDGNDPDVIIISDPSTANAALSINPNQSSKVASESLEQLAKDASLSGSAEEAVRRLFGRFTDTL